MERINTKEGNLPQLTPLVETVVGYGICVAGALVEKVSGAETAVTALAAGSAMVIHGLYRISKTIDPR